MAPVGYPSDVRIATNTRYTKIDRLVPKDLQKLVFQFFVIFSRFEYALKCAYITADAKRAWGKFAKSHRQAFALDKTPVLRAACDYFEVHPPGKQVVANRSLK